MSDPDGFTPLDDVDRGILQLLQRDARNTTAVEMGEAVGVSDATVRNRIEALEDRGILQGYVPTINYERAGYPLELQIRCTAPISEREKLAKEALAIEGVVEVTDLMTGRNNIEVRAIAPTHQDLTQIAVEIDELGLAVESEVLVSHHYFRPFNHFGVDDVSAGEDGISDV